MKVMILCGVFAKENENEVNRHAKRSVEYSANVFQEKLIRGFELCDVDVTVLSAPFIGSYPNASDIFSFRGFESKSERYHYVYFNNVWGFRNFSRAKSLKRAIRSFVETSDTQKLIVVYSPHTPFLETAVYAKKKDPNIKICLVVPDLPQYMNLDAKVSWIYKVGKKVDIAKFNKLNRFVDSYMLLTEAMKEKLHVGNRPYCVVEGIIDEDIFEKNEQRKKQIKKSCNEKYIVYTGKTNERFGVKKLVDAFCQLTDPSYRLILCGRGDVDTYIRQKQKEDPRIIATGQVTPGEAAEWVLKADVLVNPRENDEEYTKYSFPSKIIEYLASGNPVVAYMLDGMPDVYREFIYPIDLKKIECVLNDLLSPEGRKETEQKKVSVKKHFLTLTGKTIANELIVMTNQ